MAIINPKNLYSGNSGIFNSTPYIDFGINQLAQKQAKSDAMDRYFAEQSSKVNTKGLAPEEAEAVLGTKNNLQQYYQQNKNAIHGNDIGALTKVNQYLNKMNQIVTDGQDKTDQQKGLNKARLVPGVSDRFTPDAMKSMDNLNAPIYKKDANGEYQRNDYDPNTNPNGYKSFDMNQNIFNPKTLSAKDMESVSKNYWGGIKNSKDVTAPLTLPDGTQSNTQFERHTVRDLSGETGVNAVKGLEDLYNNSPEIRQTVDQGHPFAQMKAEHESDFNLLNDTYKKLAGSNITNGGQLYATMEYLKHKDDVLGTSKLATNQDAKTAQAQAFALKKQAIGNQNTISHIRLSNGLKNDTNGNEAATTAVNVLNDMKQKINDAQPIPIPSLGNFTGYKNGDLLKVSDPTTLSSPLLKGVGGDGVIYDKKADQFYIHSPASNDGSDGKPIDKTHASVSENYTPLSKTSWAEINGDESYGKSKNAAAAKNAVSRVVTSDNLYNALNNYDKPSQSQPNQKSISPKVAQAAPVSIIHTRGEYKGAGWTDAQINQALKAGKIKVK